MRIKILAEIRRLCLFFVFSISDTPILRHAYSVGVSEIEKTKKRQSHQISAKVLILIAPPMSDVHTKNQRPSSKNGLGRACLRPRIAGAPKSLHGILTSTEAHCSVSPIKGHRKVKMNIFTFRYYLVFLIFWIWGLGRSASPFCHGAPVCPSVSDTGLPYLSAVMSHLWRDFSLVMRIIINIIIIIIIITRLMSPWRRDITVDRGVSPV